MRSHRLVLPRASDRGLSRLSRAPNITAVASLAVSASLALAACSSSSNTTGVPASPRVVTSDQPIPKGGGVYKVGSPYMVSGRWYTPREQPGYDAVGIASWYGDDFHGRKTANGEIYDMNRLTAAHPTLPMPVYAYVTNLANNRTILVRINDRGPFVANRIIDLSRASARALGLERQGLARVRVRYAGRAPLNGDDSRERTFLASRGMPQQMRHAQSSPRALPPSWLDRRGLGAASPID